MFWMALLIMAVIGIGLGLVLAWGSKRFFVEMNPLIEQVEAALPGVNCGACGYPGCSGYAEAIVNTEAAMNLCAPGAAEVAQEIAGIMGAEVEAAQPSFAVNCCQGGDVSFRFVYEGVADCRAAMLLGISGGRKACTAGCLGFGTCAKACPFAAITLGENRLPVVDEDKCTGCKRCVLACPRSLNRVEVESCCVFVKCHNCEKGAVINKICSHGCIGCKKCEKECPFDAIKVVNNLAVIDYDKCKLCGKCVKVCPKQVIVNLRKERKERQKKREAKIDPKIPLQKTGRKCCSIA